MAYNNRNNNGNYNNFDLNSYETVKRRKTRLKNDHPNSVIIPLPLSDISYAGNYVLMGALIWKDKKTYDELPFEQLAEMTKLTASATPQNAGVVMTAIAVLTKADGVGFSLSMAGGKGADKNAWVENAEESAVGRALDNMGYHSGSASQEEMKKVEHIESVMKEKVQLENQINAMYGQLMSQGHNPGYLTQIMSQNVRPFNQLSELSVEELQTLLGAYQAVGGQSYQQQVQQQPTQQAPQMIPGAPAPMPAR